jgi:glycosyltransferase involved in cell wall biosynthesis
LKIVVVGLATFDQMAGGSARYLSGVSEWLRSQGHEVRIVTAGDWIRTPGFTEVGLRGQLARSARRLLVIMPSIAGIVIRSRPDVVYVHFALDGAAAVVAARLVRRPVVTQFQGPWAAEAMATGRRGGWPLSTRLRRAIERYVYRRSALCITLSEAFATLLADQYDVPKRKIRVIPGGIDANRFAPQDDRQAVRKELGWPEAFTLVSVRRLVPRMGLDVAIRALPLIRSPANARLVLVGTGPEEPSLKQLAEEGGVNDRVSFLGRVPDGQLPLVYQAADVCVVPSRQLEGFGYVAVESLAAGTPVIAAPTDGLTEILGPLEPRWLVDPEPSHFAAAVSQLAADRAAYPSDDECKEYARRFDWSRIGAEVSQALKAVGAAR